MALLDSIPKLTLKQAPIATNMGPLPAPAPSKPVVKPAAPVPVKAAPNPTPAPAPKPTPAPVVKSTAPTPMPPAAPPAPAMGGNMQPQGFMPMQKPMVAQPPMAGFLNGNTLFPKVAGFNPMQGGMPFPMPRFKKGGSVSKGRKS